MADDIGSIKSVQGTSMGLNGQSGQGAQKPMPKGNPSPGDTKPPKEPEGPTPMPK